MKKRDVKVDFKLLFELYAAFFKVGAITFGGGYAMLPMLQKELADKKKWTTNEELLDYFAVGQCTPGVIAVNTATFIGYNLAGVLGAFTAVFGIVSPSLIIISVIAKFVTQFSHLEWIQHAFAGIRTAVAVLVLQAVIKMWKSGVKDKIGVVIFLITFLICLIFSFSPVYIVIAAIVLGITVKKIYPDKEDKSANVKSQTDKEDNSEDLKGEVK